MFEFKVKAYNEKVQVALQSLLDTTVELDGIAVVGFDVEIGDPAIYTVNGVEASVSFVEEAITITTEDGEEITLEALKNFVYTVVFGDESYAFTAEARAKQLPATQVASKIFNILLNNKKKELGLTAVKAPRKPSEARLNREKLAAEKLLLAQLRAKKKASKATPAEEI